MKTKVGDSKGQKRDRMIKSSVQIMQDITHLSFNLLFQIYIF